MNSSRSFHAEDEGNKLASRVVKYIYMYIYIYIEREGSYDEILAR